MTLGCQKKRFPWLGDTWSPFKLPILKGNTALYLFSRPLGFDRNPGNFCNIQLYFHLPFLCRETNFNA